MHELKVFDVAQAVGGRLEPAAADCGVTGVSIDTRTLTPGALYVALRGERYDGHSFVSEAIARGAAAVLVEEAQWERLRPGIDPAATPVIGVPDTLKALQRMAAWRRATWSGPVVGVTGSNGKTTTKDMVAAVLAQRESVLATAGNFNNEIGLPLTLLRLEPTHRAIVLEMGMRGSGEIERLARIAKPTIGVVTNVGPVHVEILGSLEKIAEAKAELVESLPRDGVAVLNADDPRVAAMRHRTDARVLTYGLGAEADVRATDITPEGFAGVRCRVHTQGEAFQLLVPAPGVHNVYNALAAIAVGTAAGVPVEEAIRAFQSLQRTSMRLEVVRLSGSITVLNDAYNASPASVQSALRTLAELPGARRWAVLGDMLELGDFARAEHRRIGELCAEVGIDRLLAVGAWAHEVADGARQGGMPPERVVACAEVPELIEQAIEWASEGDLILVKASRGLRLERVVEGLLRHFGEVEDVEPPEGGAAR